jgi:hypothetical protein
VFEIAASERHSEAVIRGVATVSGEHPADILPLFRAVDADALDALYVRAGDGSRDDVRVTFTFSGYEVVVDDDVISLRDHGE